MRKLGLIFFMVFLLAACQTKYQEGDLTGGVRALQVTADTYRISAKGNGFTSESTIQDYVLLKAAETAISRNATHFVIFSTKDTTRVETGQTSSTANLIGDTVWINPGTTYNIVKPGQDTMIKLLSISKGETIPNGAYNAREVHSIINSRVQRPKKNKQKIKGPTQQ